MAVVAESTRDEALRGRIRSAIVDRQKRLVCWAGNAPRPAANCRTRRTERRPAPRT